MNERYDGELSRARLTYIEAVRHAKRIEEEFLQKKHTHDQNNIFEDPLDHQKSKPPK